MNIFWSNLRIILILLSSAGSNVRALSICSKDVLVRVETYKKNDFCMHRLVVYNTSDSMILLSPTISSEQFADCYYLNFGERKADFMMPKRSGHAFLGQVINPHDSLSFEIKCKISSVSTVKILNFNVDYVPSNQSSHWLFQKALLKEYITVDDYYKSYVYFEVNFPVCALFDN